MGIKNILDELDEIVYVSDVDTYELLYLNKAGCDALNITDYKGKKCFNVLQGKTHICEFCTNSRLCHDNFYTWEHFNPIMRKRFVVKDKLINWEGSNARLEWCIDSEKVDNLSSEIKYKIYVEQQLLESIEDITSCDTIYASINSALKRIGSFYKASRAYIFDFVDDKYVRNTYEWCKEGVESQLQYLQRVKIEYLKRWVELFNDKKNVIINDVSELKHYNFCEYELLSPQGVERLIAAPLWFKGKIAGFIGVDNPKADIMTVDFLNLMSYFVVAEINKNSIENKLEVINTRDSLTLLYNRNSYYEHIEAFSKSIHGKEGVLCADINGLKGINDSKGRDTGDSLVISVAKILKKHFSEYNVYRMGGDEFTVICFSIEQEEFQKRIDAVEEEIKEVIKCDVAIGYKWSAEAIDIKDLVNEADEVMRQNKQNYYKSKYSHHLYRMAIERIKNIRALNYGYNGDESEESGLITRTEIEYRKRILEYDLIVQQSCDEIYQVNVSSDTISLVYRGNSMLVPYPVESPFTNMVDYILGHLVHPDDRKTVRSSYSKKNILDFLLKSYKQQDIEFRRRGSDGLYYWVSSSMHKIVYPQDLLEGKDMTLLIIIKDINNKVLEREKAQMIETKHYLAMMKTCGHICDVDIEAGTYEITVNGDYIMDQAPRRGNYSDFINFMAEKMVYPNDKGIWLRNMLLDNLLDKFKNGESEITFDYRIRDYEGRYVWRNNLAVFLGGDNTRKDALLIIAHDIQAKKQVESLNLKNELLRQEIEYNRELRAKDERYKIIAERTGAGIFEWNRVRGDDISSGKMVFVTGLMAEEYNYNEKNINFFYFLYKKGKIHSDDMEDFREFLALKQNYKEFVGRVSKDGKNFRWKKFAISEILAEDGRTVRVIGTIQDVDAETKANEALKFKAERDSVTGLLNQDTFYNEAAKILEEHQWSGYAVIVMDIDKFKVINNLYGMTTGDKILKDVASIINDNVNDRGISSRMYADVFYIFCEYRSREETVEIIRNIINGINSIELESMVTPYFGISTDDGKNYKVMELCEMAGFAHKSSKLNSITKWTFYDSGMKEQFIEEKQIESEMEHALLNNEFKVYLQPKYIIGESKVIGAEALVRWHHPTKGLIPPNKFIPLFERNGFILQLDIYVWERVCELLNKWSQQGHEPIPISVNVSRLHLVNMKFRSVIKDLLNTWNVKRELFELEITESLFFSNLAHIITVLSELKEDGFILNMDDFGSGFSSLNMLKNIPIDILKIDCHFLDGHDVTKKARTIIKYIVGMAKEIDLKVVAEGVETEEQEKFLKSVGCDVAQGFYFSRPIPIDEFERKFLKTIYDKGGVRK